MKSAETHLSVYVGIAVWVLLTSASTAPGQSMYWASGGGEIHRADIDGSNPQTIVTGIDQPLGVALDADGGRLYWCAWGDQLIQSARLDGSDLVTIVDTGSGRPWGIALDLASGKLYWSETGTGKIRRANLDGTEAEDLILLESNHPRGIVLDPAGGKVYWAQGNIRRANLDGTDVEILFSNNVHSPNGLAIDFDAGQAYWTTDLGRTIERANLDGTDHQLLVDEFSVPGGVALDIEAGWMYWSASRTTKRAHLDGSHVQELVEPRGGSGKSIVLDLTCTAAGPDCQPNGIPDACDLARGISIDCDGTGVPDDCEAPPPPEEDCNGNTQLDACEPDCNENGVPDDCDIDFGISPDANLNGIPDDCVVPGQTLQIDVDTVALAGAASVTATVSDYFSDTCWKVCDIAGEWISPTEYHIDWFTYWEEGICLQVVINLSSEIDLGTVAPGDYVVSGAVWTLPCGFGIGGPIYDLGATRFSVSPESVAIPTLSEVGMVVMFGLVVFAGATIIRRKHAAESF